MKRKLIWCIVPLLLTLIMLAAALQAHRQAIEPVPTEAAGSNATPAAPLSESTGNTKGDIPDTIQTPAVPEPAAPVPAKAPYPAPAESAASETVPVNVAVVGKSGELLYGPGAVKLSKSNSPGATALGALEATGLPFDFFRRYPDLVEAIAGLRNKGQAGWLYKINDDVPLVAAGKKPVQANDRVIWWYSDSINDPPPSWDKLAK